MSKSVRFSSEPQLEGSPVNPSSSSSSSSSSKEAKNGKDGGKDKDDKNKNKKDGSKSGPGGQEMVEMSSKDSKDGKGKDAKASEVSTAATTALLHQPPQKAIVASAEVIKRNKKLNKKLAKNPLKKFYFRLDKIAAQFEMALDGAFFEFEFGGIYATEQVDTGETVTKKKTEKGADGKDEEVEYQEQVVVKKIKVFKPRASTFFTRVRQNIKAKSKVNMADQNYENYWYGTYADLAKECVTVRLWHYGGTTEPNHLIGVGKEMFDSIVSSKIDREIRILKYVPGAASFRKETMARITFKLEFQEDYNYNIVFKGWELRRIYEPVFRHRDENSFIERMKRLFKMQSGDRVIHFEIIQSHQSLIDSITGSIFDPIFGNLNNKCSLRVKKEGTSGQDDGVILYPGTRSWLEDENLSITLKKNICGCIPITIGRTAEELQGVLDYGHIDSTIEISENINCLTCCMSCCFSCIPSSVTTNALNHKYKESAWTNFLSYLLSMGASEKQKFKIAGTVDSNLIVTGDSLPLFRQVGNADPTQDGFLQAEGMTFLVVKVLRAKGLSFPSRTEFKENLNPNVTAYWNGMQKSSRTMKASADPYWDDDLFFKIMDRHTERGKPPRRFDDFPANIRDSTVELVVWDNEGLSSRSPIGTCSVAFEDIYFRRTIKKIMSFTSNGRNVERLVYVSGERYLESPFANDGSERKAKSVGVTTSNSNSADKSGFHSSSFIEFQIYFDRLDSNPIPLINKRQKEKEADAKKKMLLAQQNEILPLTSHQIKSGRAFWDQALKNILLPHQSFSKSTPPQRYFPFYGIDERTGLSYFLPTFLKPMQPPADVRAIGTLLFYIYSIEIKKAEPVNQEGSDPRNDIWTWSDPFYFLEKRKGDVRDHALILCNFLLGLGMDAYVCIGTARTRDNDRASLPQPHFWVMTREEEDVEEVIQKPTPPGQKPSDEPPEVVTSKRYFVRFWETTSCRTFILNNSMMEPPQDKSKKKYLEEPDLKPAPANELEFRKQREKQADDERKKELGIAPKEEEESDSAEPGSVDPSKLGADSVDVSVLSRLEEDEPGLRIPKTAEEVKKSIRNLKGARAMIAQNPHDKIPIDIHMRKNLAKKDIEILEAHNLQIELELDDYDAAYGIQESELLTLTMGSLIPSSSTPASGMVSPAASPIAAVVGEPENDSKQSKALTQSINRSIFDQNRDALLSSNRVEMDYKIKLVHDSEDPILKIQKKKVGKICPYLSIDTVFNHKHLYANLVQHDPELVIYDFERHPTRWFEFNESSQQQYLNIRALHEFFHDRGVASVKAPQRDSEDLQDRIISLLRDSIREKRLNPDSRSTHPSMSTTFIEKFHFQTVDSAENTEKNTAVDFILKRLDHEHRVAVNPPELSSLFLQYGGESDIDYDYVDKTWRPKITQELERGYVFMEQCILYKHCDTNRLLSETLERCREMVECSEARDPSFAVGVRLFRMAASVCPVRVCICLIAKDHA